MMMMMMMMMTESSPPPTQTEEIRKGDGRHVCQNRYWLLLSSRFLLDFTTHIQHTRVNLSLESRDVQENENVHSLQFLFSKRVYHQRNKKKKKRKRCVSVPVKKTTTCRR